MKRFFTMIVAACAFFVVSAQYPLVTLSHNGDLSFFDNLYAFESAYNAAENGDTIFLSKGEFILNGGSFTIKKRLSVVGNGYDSHILGDITIDMSNNPDSQMQAPLFDGVKMDVLNFASDGANSMLNLGTSEIRRCWIGSLRYGALAGTKVTIDQCTIEDAHFMGYNSYWGDVLVKNSKIRGRRQYDYLYGITALNCNISNAEYFPHTMISCIFQQRSSGQPYVMNTCSIINSVLDFTPTNSSVYSHDCYIYDSETQPLLDDSMNCHLNLEELGYLGQDGTVAGIMGGESPFSESPSVPTVDIEKSSVDYDAENNKLKVSITVKAD